MRGDADVLAQLAVEHRELTARSGELRRTGGDRELTVLTAAIVEHELAHRLLVHPLLRRDRWGRTLFEARREEQLLLADRLGHALAADGPRSRALVAFDREFAAHTDREEILSFPHLRREIAVSELRELGALRRDLRPSCTAALEDHPRLVSHGRWASAPRHELCELVGLPDRLVEALPTATAGRTTRRSPRPLQGAARD